MSSLFISAFILYTCLSHSTHYRLTLCDGACSTGFGEAIALAHGTTETYIHKSLSGWRQWSSS